jgi:hypothetical protein
VSERARFLRQLLLSGWGDAGQSAVGRSSARVLGEGPSLARETARRYAERAGFSAFSEAPLDLERLSPAAIVRTPAAREVLAGARLALAAMRDVVGFGETPR